MEEILARLRLNDSRKPTPPKLDLRAIKQDSKDIDKLISGLNEQTKALKQQEKELRNESDSDNQRSTDESSGSGLYTPGHGVLRCRQPFQLSRVRPLQA